MANGQDPAGFRAEGEPAENAAPPDWLETARQAFLWRYFWDGCRPSDRGNGGPVVRGVPPFEWPKRPKMTVNAGRLGGSEHPPPPVPIIIAYQYEKTRVSSALRFLTTVPH